MHIPSLIEKKRDGGALRATKSVPHRRHSSAADARLPDECAWRWPSYFRGMTRGGNRRAHRAMLANAAKRFAGRRRIRRKSTSIRPAASATRSPCRSPRCWRAMRSVGADDLRPRLGHHRRNTRQTRSASPAFASISTARKQSRKSKRIGVAMIGQPPPTSAPQTENSMPCAM